MHKFKVGDLAYWEDTLVEIHQVFSGFPSLRDKSPKYGVSMLGTPWGTTLLESELTSLPLGVTEDQIKAIKRIVA